MKKIRDEATNERLMLAAVFFFWFSVYTYPSFLTTYAVNDLGATGVLAGMIVGSYGLTQMVLRIPLGILSDVVKRRKPFVMMGLGFSLLASGGLALTALRAEQGGGSGALAVAALILRGMSGVTAATWVQLSVMYSASCRGEQVSAAMSRLIVPQCGSQIVAMLLGAQLAGRLGAVYAFLLASAAGIIGLVIMACTREQRPEGEPMTLRGLLAVARNRQLMIGTLLATIYQLVAWATVQGFVQNWAREVIGLATAELGWLSVANLLPNTVFSRLSGTVLTRRFGKRAVLAGGFVCLAAACFLYPRTRSPAALLSVQTLLGTGVGLIMPLTMSGAIEGIPDEKRGAAMGIYQAVYGLGMFLGPVLAGAVLERFPAAPEGGASAVSGYTAIFYMAMLIAVAGLVFSLLLTERKKKDGAESEAL